MDQGIKEGIAWLAFSFGMAAMFILPLATVSCIALFFMYKKARKVLAFMIPVMLIALTLLVILFLDFSQITNIYHLNG
jgi:hypothetical protein